MVTWPDRGTRVAVRYRRPAGSVPPLTDAVGHLLDVTPLVRVRTKTGAVVHFAAEDVVALRTLSDIPVRMSQIRALEHAAASARPGTEQQWLDGWLLRAGSGVNYAVPLQPSATPATIPVIADWYRQRGLAPRLLIPDRLLRFSDTGEHASQMLVCDLRSVDVDDAAPLTDRDAAAVSDAPDGTRWVGLSAASPHPRTELAWGAARGATRGYLRITDDDRDSAALARSLGFVLHHRARYVTPAT